MVDSFKEFKEIVSYEYSRAFGKPLTFIRLIMTLRPFYLNTLKHTFWLRACSYFKQVFLFKYTLFPIAKLQLYRYTHKYSIVMSHNSNIGKGLHVYHPFSIIVNPLAEIGENCTMSHGVTIGQTNRGKKKGVPKIGNSVFLGPYCVILGAVKIGDNAVIGPNVVVTDDIPENAVVAGQKIEIVSYKGSEGYVLNTEIKRE